MQTYIITYKIVAANFWFR